MIDELGQNPDLSDRAWSYVQQILMVSANVAAVTGSPWKSTATWLRSNIPALTDAMAIHMKVAFDAYVAEALIELAKRIPSGDPSLFTGPTPADVAKELGITSEQLRVAKANRCGLTSIDPPDRKATDRERKAEARKKAGMMKQGDRSNTAIMKDLAKRMGWSLAKAYRKRGDQPLDAFVVSHDHDEKEVSALIRTFDSGQNFLTEPANDDDPVVTPQSSGTIQAAMVAANDDAPRQAPTLMEDGYTGRNITMSSSEVTCALAKHPVLAKDLQRHLDAIDDIMSKTPAENHKRVIRNLLVDRSRLVHRELRDREIAIAA